MDPSPAGLIPFLEDLGYVISLVFGLAALLLLANNQPHESNPEETRV